MMTAFGAIPWRTMAALALGLAVAACAGTSVPFTGLCVRDSQSTVTLRAAEGANGDTAVAVDIVVAADEALAATLAELTGPGFLARRAQLRRDHPETLEVFSWELAPGQTLGPQEIKHDCDPEAVYVFAAYGTPGDHRVLVTDPDDLIIDLGPETFEVRS